MRNIIVILKKELKRFFTDYRMIASLILPGVMIFVMYSIIGSITTSMNQVDQGYKYRVYAVNEPDLITEAFNSQIEGFQIDYLDTADLSEEEMIDAVKTENADLYIKYSTDFNFVGSSEDNKIFIYFNSVKKESSTIYQIYTSTLNAVEDSLTENIFDFAVNEDLASEEDKSTMIISLIMPYLLIIFLFTAALSIVPESIAGEKERGTIATLLVTPLKRTDLAIGKIISLACVATISALSSFIGIILSLPKLMGNLDLTISYGALHYTLILFIILTLVLLSVGLLSVISAFAKSVKEAASYAGPVIGLIAVVGVFSFFGSLPDNVFLYIIPIFNSLLSLTNIFANEINLIGVIMTISFNLIYTLLLGVLLAYMFNNEKIMFNK